MSLSPSLTCTKGDSGIPASSASVCIHIAHQARMPKCFSGFDKLGSLTNPTSGTSSASTDAITLSVALWPAAPAAAAATACPACPAKAAGAPSTATWLSSAESHAFQIICKHRAQVNTRSRPPSLEKQAHRQTHKRCRWNPRVR